MGGPDTAWTEALDCQTGRSKGCSSRGWRSTVAAQRVVLGLGEGHGAWGMGHMGKREGGSTDQNQSACVCTVALLCLQQRSCHQMALWRMGVPHSPKDD